MAALAIDVVTLYVAGSEVKRAADAAALAGAMGIANSGATTLCAGSSSPCASVDPNFANAQTLAENMAIAAINAILQVNTVEGQTPTATVTYDWSRQGNPLITVALKQTGLPTFFSKIWGRTGSTVSATSTAEVYNPSNNSSPTPISPMAVKPWLIANNDPNNLGNQFVNPSSGLVETPVIGEQLNLAADCNPSNPGSCVPRVPPLWGTTALGQPYPWVAYVPALVTSNNGNNVCSSLCSGVDYEQSIACSDMTTPYVCGTAGAAFDNSTYPAGSTGRTATGAECLTNASGTGLGAGQDSLVDAPFTSPPQITAGGGQFSSSLVSTSPSIVTIPIADTINFPPAGGGPVQIDGFIQGFINQVEAGIGGEGNGGDVNITVLNVAGCVVPNSNPNPPVVGGMGLSPVPVRLVLTPTP
jgi:hypothetical protein